MRRRLMTVTAILAVLALVATACGDDDTADDVREDVEDVARDARDEAEDLVDDVEDAITGDRTVTIEEFAFDPDALTISAGDSVRFRNDDTTMHAVVSDTYDGEPSDAFDEQVAAGESVDITLDDAGEYTYFCSIHTNMTGTITVE